MQCTSPSGGRLTGDAYLKYIKQHFDVTYHPNAIYKLLEQLGFSWITSRSKHPKQSIEVQAAFKKSSNWKRSLTFQVVWHLIESISGFRMRLALDSRTQLHAYGGEKALVLELYASKSFNILISSVQSALRQERQRH